MRVAGLLAAAALVIPAGARADDARTETVVRSHPADAKLVRESYVSLRAPLPASAGEHPPACDRIGYLRFRNPRGPRNPSRADAVITLIPGIFASAGSLDPVARNVVRLAAERGRNFEVWAIDRRSACLEDHFGTHAAEHHRNVAAAFDYYYGGKTVDGHRFAGFVPASQAGFLKEFGLGLTVRDWHEIITREMPDRSVRQRKLICGGHSLGGPLTAALVSWDYDGDPGTKDDAGYLDCAGLAGLDTSVALDGTSGGPAGVGLASQLAAQSGGSPYVDAPPFTPPVMQLPSIAAVGAFQAPDKESRFNQLIPHDPDFEVTLRLLYSKDAAQFASGQPSIRDIRLTGATVFGGIFDDNSAGISILRASLGSAVGGTFSDKNFPAPDPTLALPDQPKGPLYRWVDYDEAGTPGHDIPLNDEGEPYSTRESEVTDLHEFARVFFDAPADFVEQYFPVRLVTDFAAATGGDRSGDLANLRYDGPSQRPILLVTAGDSGSNDTSDDNGPPAEGAKPNDKPLSRDVTLPGYNHLDVAAAAWKQNDGRLEPSSAALVDFAMAVTGRGASGCLRARAAFSRRGLGRLRLGATRKATIRTVGRPARTRGRTTTWCVTGPRSGSVGAVFAQGRVAAIASTAPGHHWRHTRIGAKTKRAAGISVRQVSSRAAIAVVTRAHRVRTLVLINRAIARDQEQLRRYARTAAVATR
jgi:hypothetical protein